MSRRCGRLAPHKCHLQKSSCDWNKNSRRAQISITTQCWRRWRNLLRQREDLEADGDLQVSPSWPICCYAYSHKITGKSCSYTSRMCNGHYNHTPDLGRWWCGEDLWLSVGAVDTRYEGTRLLTSLGWLSTRTLLDMSTRHNCTLAPLWVWALTRPLGKRMIRDEE